MFAFCIAAIWIVAAVCAVAIVRYCAQYESALED